jgi:hypothetical protein
LPRPYIFQYAVTPIAIAATAPRMLRKIHHGRPRIGTGEKRNAPGLCTVIDRVSDVMTPAVAATETA